MTIFKLKLQIVHHQPIRLHHLLPIAVGQRLSIWSPQHQKAERHPFDVPHRNLLGRQSPSANDENPDCNEGEKPMPKNFYTRFCPNGHSMPA